MPGRRSDEQLTLSLGIHTPAWCTILGPRGRPMRHPAVHSVHIYESDAALIERLCGIVGSGLQIGNTVVIIATAPHRDQLVKELEAAGVDVRGRAREGRFSMIDAKQMLSTFMRSGSPDRNLFTKSVGRLLAEAKQAARSKDQGLTIFGEMVAVLWDEGKQEAAIQLEALWNDALNERAFHLHCAYPREGFINTNDDAGLAAVSQCHSHIVQ